MTIRTRLALWYSGLLILVIVILSLAVITVSRVTILTTIDQVLQQAAEEVIDAINMVPVGEFGVLDDRVVFETEEIFSAPGIAIQVWQTHQDGQPVDPVLLKASSNIGADPTPLDSDALHATQAHYITHDGSSRLGRVVTHPFTFNNQVIGVVQVATSVEPVEHANDALVVITLIAAVISMMVSVALSMWLAERALRPINRVTQAAASIVAAEDLSTRLSWDGPMDELGRLVSVFNHMMARLEQVFKVQQRFVGDVSHELRTPLTSIVGNLEIMQRYGVDQDSLEAVHREAARMSRMVNDLLLLARADYGELKVDLYPVDLEAVTLDVYEQALILAKGRELRVLLGHIEPAHIKGNTDRLRQLLLNLVNNAIKFTPDGGKVELSIYTEHNEAILVVRDTGIGISVKDQEHIFDRFFQADNSRAHRNESDGAGLGLSIVRWLVDVHHGKISVSSLPGQGTTFRVAFPLLSEAEKPSHPTPDPYTRTALVRS